ncbi:PepSY domain-containing protein [bacterium SCSIO 12741]|nr:PepSY domain-containing protein [bacterium SCSIO 12741]
MNQKLYPWIWKWHFIGGLLCLPVVILLSLTGSIYLFKDYYEEPQRKSLIQVKESTHPLSLHEQWQWARQHWDKRPQALVIPQSSTEATEFTSGRFSGKSSLFIHPSHGEVVGKIQVNQTDMYKVRKLHGELLLGAYGTKVVELVASWMVVLLLSGLYLFWPRKVGWKGLFRIRTNGPKRLMYKDLHAVSGFWFSLILLLILAGGLPWTDVFGTGYKWVQQKTDAGYPAEWKGRSFHSQINGEPLTLDQMVAQARELNLPGTVSVSLPKSENSVFSVSNESSQLSSHAVYHFDQYSGKQLYHGTWSDIGLMMKTRLWVMAFHQGQFGWWNWLLVLFTSLGLTFLSISAILSYLARKKKGKLSIPSVPESAKPGFWIWMVLILLGILLPLFGLSVLFLILVQLPRWIADQELDFWSGNQI